MKEPETASTIAGSMVYQIPLVLARRKNMGMWYYGDEARKMSKNAELVCIDNLLKRAMSKEKIVIEDEVFMAEDLLALFIKKLIALPSRWGIPQCVTDWPYVLSSLPKKT